MENYTVNAPKKSERVYMLDEIRGFAILCMVVYHGMFILRNEFALDVPIFFESWFDIIRDVFAAGFIFISGIMCRYSHDNVRRGAKCFVLGMLITYIVPFFSAAEINFGILHLLGISMMLYGLLENILEKIPPAVGAIVFALISALTWNTVFGYIGFKGLFEWTIPAKAHEIGILFPFGIVPDNFYSSDYYPLLPHFFVFLTGSYVGYWFKNNSMPRVFYRSHVRWLAAVGRVTIWIYILHAPVLLGLFKLFIH